MAKNKPNLEAKKEEDETRLGGEEAEENQEEA